MKYFDIPRKWIHHESVAGHRGCFKEHGSVLSVCDWIVLTAFLGEILLKICSSFWKFWKNRWNVVDVVVTMVVVIGSTSSTMDQRIVLTLRVILSARALVNIKQTYMIVCVLDQSCSAMMNMYLLIGGTVLMFGVMGVILFGETVPSAFGDLTAALFTLFVCLTLDGWVDIQARFKDLTTENLENALLVRKAVENSTKELEGLYNELERIDEEVRAVPANRRHELELMRQCQTAATLEENILSSEVFSGRTEDILTTLMTLDEANIIDSSEDRPQVYSSGMIQKGVRRTTAITATQVNKERLRDGEQDGWRHNDNWRWVEPLKRRLQGICIALLGSCGVEASALCHAEQHPGGTTSYILDESLVSCKEYNWLVGNQNQTEHQSETVSTADGAPV
ncbi:hypothetical protein NFI96_003388 [Prochilodus magdalenae]|nr:hypothetical protein NFI96_003388 [Prochilodus magdalenae]